MINSIFKENYKILEILMIFGILKFIWIFKILKFCFLFVFYFKFRTGFLKFELFFAV